MRSGKTYIEEHQMNEKPKILDRVEEAGYKVFENGDYDLNIIGERNPNGKPDQFDDILHIAYKENGLWQCESFQVTTDPGLYFLKNPSNVKGTAILAEGQYRGAYRIDYHRKKYKALCQRSGSVKVHRIPNYDDEKINTSNDLSKYKIDEGYFGINIHRAHSSRELLKDSIGKYSAGCTVFRRPQDLDRLLVLCGLQIKTHNWQTFTYTLLGEPTQRPSKKPKRTKKVKS